MVLVTRKAPNSLQLMSCLKRISFREITSYLLTPQSMVKALKDMGSAEQMRCLLGFSPPWDSTLTTKVWVKRASLSFCSFALCDLGKLEFTEDISIAKSVCEFCLGHFSVRKNLLIHFSSGYLIVSFSGN